MNRINNTRRDRYNREICSTFIEQDIRTKKRLEENAKKREIENKKYLSLALAIINELNKRKINILDSEFDTNLDCIIESISTKGSIMKVYKQIDSQALKNTVKRQINSKYNKKDER